MIERKAEGVAVITFGIQLPLFERFAERNVPLVFVDIGPERPGTILLKVNYRQGIRQGVQHLAALGHRKIAFIAGPPDQHSAQCRVEAFSQSLAECGIGLNPNWLVAGDHTLEGGFRAMEKILAGPEQPTGIMCSNDMTAMGVFHKAYRAGIRVPNDLSLIGFDDIQLARVMIPPLTTIQMSRLELARAAVTGLRAYVEKSAPKREYQIDTQLVVRESTSFPPGVMEDLRRMQK